MAEAEKQEPASAKGWGNHGAGDWGELSWEDMRANDEAYILSSSTKIWIITEATDDEGNREATTILLPQEY
jgi:hypothetical protein